MTSFQRVIKYLAIAFALFIIINILSAIYFGISSLANAFNWTNSSTTSKEIETLELESRNDISILDIDIDATKLTIQTGDTLKVETNHPYIKCRQKDNKLRIEEKDHNVLRNYSNSELIITLPKNIILDNTNIETGAGAVEIRELSTARLYLDLGAGKVSVDSLIVTEKAEIDGGAGDFNILSGEINNLDLDMGIGKFTLISKLTGNSKIEAGVGEVNIQVSGLKEDYRISVEKGIGTILIDKETISNDTTIGTGRNQLEIEGGVGKISIDFQKSNSVFPSN